MLAERFQHFLADTSIGNLTRWRLRLSTRLLTSMPKSVVEVAGHIGYESEPSFNRTFTREFGLPRPASEARANRPRSR